VDSADQVYLDHTNPKNLELRFSDRDLVRVWADENAATFDFLLDNGVKFDEVMPTLVNEGTIPRLFRTLPYSDDLTETINGSPGSGLVRALEKSARAKGVGFAGASGLTVRSYQDVMCVNQWGTRFWNELDNSYGFLNACL
jgi:hypothetical protein